MEKKEIAIVLKDSDFTEGRGPMVIHKVFATPELAEGYIMGQRGIFGSPQYKEHSPYPLDGAWPWRYNGYDIRIEEVIDNLAE